MERLLAKLEPLRRWLDGNDNIDSLHAMNLQARPRRVAEEFLVQVTREIGVVMRQEAFTPPGCQTYIPHEFIILLSKEDDRDWQGDKRRGLEQGIMHVLRQRTSELFDCDKLAGQPLTIELRVDGALAKGEFRVEAVWASKSSKTFVSPYEFKNSSDDLLLFPPDESEITKVNSRLRIVLYSIEILRNGVRQNIFPVTKPEITIGRGSETVEVDIPLRGDAEVSRLHVMLARDARGLYWLTAKGQNPVFINEQEVERSEPAQVTSMDDIRICSFSLCINEVANTCI
jgi:hypothetical protein